MRLADLWEVHRVRKRMVELLASEIEHGIAHLVETMVVAVAERYAIYLATEDVLHQKSRDGALSAGRVDLAPFFLHTRCARLPPPAAEHQLVQIAERPDERILGVRRPQVRMFASVEHNHLSRQIHHLLQRLHLPHQFGADARFLGLVTVRDGIRQQALQLLDFSHVLRSLLHVHATISPLAISASRARAN